jgi:translocation and assembly module TamA
MSRAATLTVAMLALLATPARADVDVEIVGVDEEIRRNVLVFLSLERYRERDDLTRQTLERLIERADREVKAALRPFGYYEPRVRASFRERNGDVAARIEIEPGPPIVVESADVSVSGPGADDPVFTSITSTPAIRPGDRLSHAAYESVKGALQRAAVTYGYFDARLTRSELSADTQRRRASIALAMETGSRYHFGASTIEQDVVSESLVRKYLRYAQDEPFDATQLLRTQFALDDSQYFSSIEVLPQERDRETLEVPVRIQAQANRRDRYSFGIGYGTDTRVRGTATWDRRIVNRRGHRLRTELQLASVKQSFETRYQIPIGDPALEKFELSAEADRRLDLADIPETRDFSLEPSITTVSGRWQRVLFTTLQRSTTVEPTERRVDTLLIPGISYASLPRGYLGEPIFSRTLYAELRGSTGFLGSDSDFLQLRLQAERVFDLGEIWHLYLRGELGASAVGRFSELPGSQRFFAGGDRSVRGFGFNDLSPVEVVQQTTSDGQIVSRLVKTGGRHLLTGTVEIIRDLPRNFGIAVFADAGNAFNSFDADLEYSAGVGVRLRTPVVTVGIDVAQPLSEPGASPRLHINFSPKL